MTVIYIILQVLLYILWLPFQITMRLGALLHVWGQRAGDFLVRPLYWSVVQAKRRGNGSPLWQQHDWQIGIGPPCEHCKKNVPPERHKNGCKFILSREKSLAPEEIAYLAGNPVKVPFEEQMLESLTESVESQVLASLKAQKLREKLKHTTCHLTFQALNPKGSPYDILPGETVHVVASPVAPFRGESAFQVKGIDYSAFEVTVWVGTKPGWKFSGDSLWPATDLFEKWDLPMIVAQTQEPISITVRNVSDSPKPFSVMIRGLMLIETAP